MQTIEGTIDHIRFQNKDDGWAAVTIKKGNELMQATGVMPGVHIGMSVKVEGEFENGKYGPSFKISRFCQTQPSDVSGIYN